jgi:hypothetical protein
LCAFVKILMNSSLGAKTVALCLRGVVPAFHGHAHNRACQVHWHPMYTEGVGLEDFEECERTFYKSNELASITRLATPFHRHQQIDEHFHFHDLDKHAASGTCDLSHMYLLRNVIMSAHQEILFSRITVRHLNELRPTASVLHYLLPSSVLRPRIMKLT